jgi:non-heme chloroperoxidase
MDRIFQIQMRRKCRQVVGIMVHIVPIGHLRRAPMPTPVMRDHAIPLAQKEHHLVIGGGEVVHYLARRGQQEVYKAAIISAVPPLMLKTDANPEGLPKSVFDDLQAQLAANRSKFYRDLAEGPFYGFNRPGVKSVEANIANWWRQGMMGGSKAHYDGIVAFSQTDFSEDLKKITIPVLVIHSEDDQIVPYVAAGPKSAKLLKNGTLITYKDFPHGMPTTQAERINADLLAFLKS